MGWMIYMLECADATLYTGITTDLQKRLRQHHAGTGAKYTRGRGPFTVVYLQSCPSRSAALKRELAIKAMTAAQKRALMAAPSAAPPLRQS